MKRFRFPLICLLCLSAAGCAVFGGDAKTTARVDDLEQQMLDVRENQRHLENKLDVVENDLSSVKAHLGMRERIISEPGPAAPLTGTTSPAATTPKTSPAKTPPSKTTKGKTASSSQSAWLLTPTETARPAEPAAASKDTSSAEPSESTSPSIQATSTTPEATPVKKPVSKPRAPSQASAAPAQPQVAEETRRPLTEPHSPAAETAPAPRTASLSPGAQRDGYNDALELVRAGQTSEARPLLQSFITHNPASPLMPNAIYWLGETWYHEKQYDQAILSFKDVAGRFPKHDKAAAALLKIGFSYEHMGDISNARFYLQNLIKDYPKSEPAALARDKLKSLGR